MTNTTSKHNIELLLPFYVNGSLGEDEKILVEQALAEDPSLQQELIFLQGLSAQVRQQQETSPGEFGLKRLQTTLKAQQTNDNNSLQQETASAAKHRWQFVAMAACLMLVVQTIMNITPEPTEYTAAGGDAITQHEGIIISVTFSPDAREQNIRDLLLEVNALIVDGPSALGIYRLSVSNDTRATISTLKAHPDLILSVQEE